MVGVAHVQLVQHEAALLEDITRKQNVLEAMLVLELLARAENASNLTLDLRSSSCVKDSSQFSQELISSTGFLSQFPSI